ncbi:MAG: hypothetical protein ACRDRX_23785 [Pseudonocardiaceae bacterium]
MDQHDSAMSILDQLKGINQDVGAFAAGVLPNDISKEDQIAFAACLVGLAITIKDRAEGAAGLVVEGNVIDDSIIDDRALPSSSGTC